MTENLFGDVLIWLFLIADIIVNKKPYTVYNKQVLYLTYTELINRNSS